MKHSGICLPGFLSLVQAGLPKTSYNGKETSLYYSNQNVSNGPRKNSAECNLKHIRFNIRREVYENAAHGKSFKWAICVWRFEGVDKVLCGKIRHTEKSDRHLGLLHTLFRKIRTDRRLALLHNVL